MSVRDAQIYFTWDELDVIMPNKSPSQSHAKPEHNLNGNSIYLESKMMRVMMRCATGSVILTPAKQFDLAIDLADWKWQPFRLSQWLPCGCRSRLFATKNKHCPLHVAPPSEIEPFTKKWKIWKWNCIVVQSGFHPFCVRQRNISETIKLIIIIATRKPVHTKWKRFF